MGFRHKCLQAAIRAFRFETVQPNARQAGIRLQDETILMVYGRIDNIELYKGLSNVIYLGLEFLKNASFRGRDQQGR